MMRKSALGALLLAWFALCGAPVRAQSVPKPFIQARQLLLLQRFDHAVQLIESVVPANEDEWLLRESLLAEAYEGQGNYGALEILSRQALERRPNRTDRIHWLLVRGRLLLMSDRLDSAQAVLESTWTAHPDDSVILQVAELYQRHSLSDLALATYLEARKIRHDSVRFALSVAELYEARRDYARATQEYFNAIHTDSSLTRQVENRVLQLVNTQEGGEQIEAELVQAKAHPGGEVVARRLLSALYLGSGRPEEAWQTAWELDSLQDQQGLSLVSFLRQAAERGYYEVAARGAAALLEHYPGSQVRYQVEWELASMALHLGDWKSARDQYAQISRTSPVVRFRIESALAYADIERRYARRLDLADSTYALVESLTPGGPYAGSALLGRAAVAVDRGELAEARTYLAAVEAKGVPDVGREEVAYRLGELAWFEGDLEAASDAWKALSDDFPHSAWVNDALQYLFLISNYSASAAGDLKLLGRAEALARRAQHDSSLALVSGLRATQDAPLAPRATFLAGVWHRDAERPDSALALWDDFVLRYPADSDAPRALWLSARLCEEEFHKPQEARRRYAQVLERYPRCHWIEDARGRIRKLDGS